MCIYKHTHAYICMCISGMYFPLLHAFQMCLLSCWLYVTNYICWDRQRKKMPFCQMHVLENCQSVLPHLSRNIYVTGIMKAWVQSLSSQKCIPVPSPLLQSKQLLFIRFFYIFCDFFMMEGYIISELILRFISLQRGHIIIFAIQRILRMTESHIIKD